MKTYFDGTNAIRCLSSKTIWVIIKSWTKSKALYAALNSTDAFSTFTHFISRPLITQSCRIVSFGADKNLHITATSSLTSVISSCAYTLSPKHTPERHPAASPPPAIPGASSPVCPEGMHPGTDPKTAGNSLSPAPACAVRVLCQHGVTVVCWKSRRNTRETVDGWVGKWSELKPRERS